MNQGNSSLIQLFLIEELVFNGVLVDESAHARACVPSNIRRVDVDFSQHLDHFVLVTCVRFCAWSSSSEVSYFLMSIRWNIDGRKRETVRDFEDTVFVQA